MHGHDLIVSCPDLNLRRSYTLLNDDQEGIAPNAGVLLRYATGECETRQCSCATESSTDSESEQKVVESVDHH
jgi:hypothetical protein